MSTLFTRLGSSLRKSDENKENKENMSENPSPIISVQFADMFSLQTFSLALIG